MVTMMEKLDLEAIGRLYGYSPPKAEPKKDLEIDWNTFSGIKDKVERVFLEKLPLLRSGQDLNFVEEILPSAAGPLYLSLVFRQQGTVKRNMEITLLQPGECIVARTILEDIDSPLWANTHRDVYPPYRRQGINRRFFELAGVAAETRAFQTGETCEISARPYQLDVLNAFLSAGYEPLHPEQLDRIRAGDKRLRISTESSLAIPMEEGRPWVVLEKGRYRIPVIKTFK